MLELLEHEHVTNAIFVPTMLQMLTAVPGAAERDYSALRSIAYGASPITTPVLKATLRTFRLRAVRRLRPHREHGRRRPARAGRPRRAAEHLLRSVGRPLPWVELRVVDPASGSDLAPARGRRSVAAGAERHARILRTPRRDGRGAHAGRLAADRRRRLRRRAGLPLPHRPDQGHDRLAAARTSIPIEVEEVLAAHPGVLDVAVIGIPDERWVRGRQSRRRSAPGGRM